MANIKGFMEKVKLPESISAISKSQAEGGGSLKAVRKMLEEKMNEKVKVYGFIGMEVYDLSRENRIEIAEIKSYLDKMDVLNNEIEELEKQRDELERKSVKKNICVCGYKLKPQDRFCPNCGKSMEEIINGQKTVQAPAMKECICGAKVPAGQFLCMECGRKIEE